MQKITKLQKQEAIEELENLRRGHLNVSKVLIGKLKTAGYELMVLGTGKQSKTSSMCIQTWVLDNTYQKGTFVGIGTASMKFGLGNKYYAWCKEVI